MKNNLIKTLLCVFVAFITGCQSLSTDNMHVFGRSDLSINTSVTTALASNTLLTGIPVQVETHAGVVQLNGYVKTIRQSDTAADVASKVEGVKTVENNLIVRK